MPKVLIVCAHRPKRSPSQRYRFEQYLPYLNEKGFDFTFSYLLNEKDDGLFYSKGNFIRKVIILLKSVLIRVKDIRRLNRFDIVFIQREASFLGSSFFEKQANKSNVRTIFDFDDSIWLADTSPGNKKWEFIKKPQKFFENVKNVDVVIAGNRYLADKARPYNKNVVIIPTTIDTDFHIPKPELRNKAVLTLGWSGSISTVKHFELLMPVLSRLKQKYHNRIKFKLLGDPSYKNDLLAVEAVAWTQKTEVDQLNTFDIGLMPLPNDAWANGKCGLKGLSYMACAVPAVMSAVGVNTEIIKNNENGFLADAEEAWFSILCRLIEDEDLRKQIGKSGRETVLDRFAVIRNKEKYLAVFKNQFFRK